MDDLVSCCENILQTTFSFLGIISGKEKSSPEKRQRLRRFLMEFVKPAAQEFLRPGRLCEPFPLRAGPMGFVVSEYLEP
jgi:hypothetical protein